MCLCEYVVCISEWQLLFCCVQVSYVNVMCHIHHIDCCREVFVTHSETDVRECIVWCCLVSFNIDVKCSCYVVSINNLFITMHWNHVIDVTAVCYFDNGDNSYLFVRHHNQHTVLWAMLCTQCKLCELQVNLVAVISTL